MTNRRAFLGKMTALTATGIGLLSCTPSTNHQANSSVDTPDTPTSSVKSPSISVSPNPFSQITHDFYGEHQAGIITPAQRHIYFLVVDLYSTDTVAIAEMFKQWTTYAAKLTQGHNVANYSTNPHLPPADTGDADSLGAYGLTLTFGVSSSFFDKLGLQDKKPVPLKDLPRFPRDQLRAELSGGDICIQACSEDPQVAFHAVRQLVRTARDKITMRWSQSGFNAYDSPADTPRNLFAFKDGTANADALKDADKWLWVDSGEPWFLGGTYLVARTIQMHLETWDRTSLKGQEDTFGRHRDTGASIGKTDEFAQFDVNERNKDGDLIIAEDTHVGLAKRTGQQILRRSFSYASGIDSRTGQFNAGLLFISFQKSPDQFSVIQNAFGNIDRMTEYTTHIGSGLFACFGGIKIGEYLGQRLFEG